MSINKPKNLFGGNNKSSVGRREIDGLPYKDWIQNELTPVSRGGEGRRAHQWTLNSFTWGFLEQEGFAAVPVPMNYRSQDMLAGLSISRPGDLLYFFQSNPKYDGSIRENRVGLRGLYRIVSDPFLGRSSHTITLSGRGPYTIHGECGSCGKTAFPLGRNQVTGAPPSCPDSSCGFSHPLPSPPIDWYQHLTLPWRVLVEPIIHFDLPVPDERAYGDWTDSPNLWVGRQDNASSNTGRSGKGSSIRQLQPYEAEKLLRMLFNEPSQTYRTPSPTTYSGTPSPITDDLGFLAIHPQIKKNGEVRYEYDLNVWMSRTFDDLSAGSIASCLGINPDEIWYVSNLFPWGYTGNEADFVIVTLNTQEEMSVYIIEAKTGKVTDRVNEGVIQVSMYVHWVLQRLMRYIPPSISIRAIPITLGHRWGVRGYVAAAPTGYSTTIILDGISRSIQIEPVRFVKYIANGTYSRGTRATSITFVDDTSSISNRISWTTSVAQPTDDSNRSWLRNNEWADSRASAGLPR